MDNVNGFDQQTEVLTENGWKLFKNVNEKEKIATLNQENHELEYKHTANFQEFDFNGKMYSFSGRDINFLVTQNHDMYFSTATNKHNPPGWKLMKADNLLKVLQVAKGVDHWNGKDPEYFQVGENKIPIDIWAEFLGYYLSEGSCTFYKWIPGDNAIKCKDNIKSMNQYIVCIHQTPGTDKYKKMEIGMNKIPFGFFKTDDGWRCGSKDLYYEVCNYGKFAHLKRVPDYAKNFTRKTSKILYDGLMLGDGTISKGKTGDKLCYYTSSPGLADDFQQLLLRVGYAGDVSWTDRIGREVKTNPPRSNVTRYIEYRVGIKKFELKQGNYNTWNRKEVDYNGKIYRLDLENQVIYVRRNGRAAWCGS